MTVLGDYTLGVDLLGGDPGDSSDDVVASSEVLGNVGLGWGMLGGDGSTGEAAPPSTTLDRVVRLYGDSGLINASYVSRSVVLYGDASLINVLVDRHLVLHGDSAIHVYALVDRSLMFSGDSAFALPRTYSVSMTIELTSPRNDAGEPEQKVGSYTTFYT